MLLNWYVCWPELLKFWQIWIIHLPGKATELFHHVLKVKILVLKLIIFIKGSCSLIPDQPTWVLQKIELFFAVKWWLSLVFFASSILKWIPVEFLMQLEVFLKGIVFKEKLVFQYRSYSHQDGEKDFVSVVTNSFGSINALQHLLKQLFAKIVLENYVFTSKEILKNLWDAIKEYLKFWGLYFNKVRLFYVELWI